MLKLFSAYTTEIDDADVALEEILSQINLDNLAQNSVGIISLNPEFIDTGIIDALHERLPFDLIGVSTMAGTAGDEYGMYGLTLTVLTGDNVTFQTAFSEPLTADGYLEKLETMYQTAFDKQPEKPALIFSFFPMAINLSGSVLLQHIDRLSDGVPIFGTLSGDVTLTQENCYTILNEKHEHRSAAILLVHGDVNPRFIVSSLAEKNISQKIATVTESDGCIIKKVDGKPISEFLKDIGLVSRKETGIGAVNVPLMVDYGEGRKPVAIRVYNIFENGDALCGGFMPEGVTFSIGSVDRDGIMGTANAALQQILETEDVNGVIVFSCMSRYVMLAPNQNEEMQKFVETIGDSIPYSLTYSGGEICPVYSEDGIPHNYFHNYTLVACIL